MATNLLNNDTPVTVWNRSPQAAAALGQIGATVADSLTSAVQDADLIFTMLSTPDAVKEVMLSANGGLSQMKPGAVWVDCSTVNPSFSREAVLLASAAGITFLDAPVAGSKPQAEGAQLTFFVGGQKKYVEMVQPYLEKMGAKILHLGEVGTGSSFKMLVNALLAQSMIAFSEMVLLGEKMGLDKQFLLDTLPKLPVTAPFTQFKTGMIANDSYEVNFPLELMHKDLHLAAVTAYEVGQPLSLTNTAKELYASAVKEGLGREDFAAIHRLLEQ